MSFLVVCAALFIVILGLALVNGWYSLIAIWLGSVCLTIMVGWLAFIYIRPRYPDWWERHIVGTDLLTKL